MIIDLSDRRDNCSSTAKTTLCKIFNFIEVDLTLFSFQSKVLLCNVDQRTTCDGRKDAVRLRCYNLAVFSNEDEVCSACLLNFCTSLGIKVHVLIKALFVSIYDSMKAHCVVQASLDVTGSARCGTVIVADTDRDRFGAAFKVRTNRCCKDTELIFVSRFNTDHGVGTKHVRAKIKCCAGTIWRNPCSICLNNLLNSVDKSFLREYRHFKSCCRCSDTLCVQVRTESNDMSVFCCVCLQTLEYTLRILKHTSTLVEYDIRVCA